MGLRYCALVVKKYASQHFRIDDANYKKSFLRNEEGYRDGSCPLRHLLTKKPVAR